MSAIPFAGSPITRSPITRQEPCGTAALGGVPGFGLFSVGFAVGFDFDSD
jgi:hypothetical protein